MFCSFKYFAYLCAFLLEKFGMKRTTLKTNLLIHLFTLAHILVVLSFAWAGWNDEIPLTCLTILMIILVARTYDFPLDLSAVMALLFCFAGFFMGTKGGEWLQPFTQTWGKGISNAICTMCVTELLGWATCAIATKVKRNDTNDNATKK